MPYGLSKKSGGDSPANVAKMERCVQNLMKTKGYDKPKAVMICKASIQGTRKK